MIMMLVLSADFKLNASNFQQFQRVNGIYCPDCRVKNLIIVIYLFSISILFSIRLFVLNEFNFFRNNLRIRTCAHCTYIISIIIQTNA